MKRQQKQFKPKRGQVPTKHCSSCANCTGGYCATHARPVDNQLNRCFYHTDYQPQAGAFKVSPQLEKIMEIESKANQERQQGWLREHNKMVEEIQKEIQLAKQLKGNVA